MMRADGPTVKGPRGPRGDVPDPWDRRAGLTENVTAGTPPAPSRQRGRRASPLIPKGYGPPKLASLLLWDPGIGRVATRCWPGFTA